MHHTPPKLKAATVDLKSDAIKQRHDFSHFMQESGLHDTIMKHLETRDGVNGIGTNVYFIGGSQAWKKWAETSVPASTHLTPMERSALVAGNTDIFYLADSEEGCDALMCDLHDVMAKKLIKDCNKLLDKRGYTMQVKCYGFTSGRKCLLDDPKMTYTMFPAYSMMFHLVQKSKTRRGMETPFHEKLALYLEVCHVPKLDVLHFANTYMQSLDGMFYLNVVGLVTFANLIRKNRAVDKGGIDVDSLRSDIVAKRYNMVELYDHVNSKFHEVFSKCPVVYTESVINMLFMQGMKARSANVNALCDVFDEWLTEKMRPYINSFIKVTAEDIAVATKNKAFMFVVGGDAMRRFKKNISTTKDIDTKVYIPKNDAATRNTVIEIVKRNMARLVTYVIRYKGEIFGDQPSDNVGFAAEDNGVKAAIKFITNNPKNVQFRLREIKKHKDLPVDLFSVDYRAYFQGTYLGASFNLKHGVSILDVAIQENKHKKAMSEIVEVTKQGIPVANLDWLLHDIHSTYDDDKLLSQRIIAKKRGKDADRFYKLRHMYMQRLQGAASPSSPGRADLDKTNLGALMYVKSPDEKVDHVPHNYLKYFESLHTKSHKSYKFKMPFDSTILDFELPVIHFKKYNNEEIVLSRTSSMRTASMEDVFEDRKRSRSKSKSMSVS